MANGQQFFPITTPPFNPDAPDLGIPNDMLMQLALGRGGSPLVDLGATIASLGGPVGARVAENLRFQSARSEGALRNLALLENIQRSRQRRGVLDEILRISQGEVPEMDEAARAAAEAEGQRLPTTEERLQGLLAAAAPEQAAAAMLGRERSAPAIVRTLEALADPEAPQRFNLSPDEISQLKSNLVKQGSTDSQLATLDLMLRGIQIQQEQLKLAEESREQRTNKGALVQTVRRDLKDAVRLAEINSELAGTVLEAGVPFPDIRRAAASGAAAVGRLIGIDTSEAERLVNLVDEFDKISSRFAASSAARLFDNQAITNFQLETIQDSVPSMQVAPGANERVIADVIDILSDAAENENLGITDLARFREASRQLRAGEFGRGDGGRRRETRSPSRGRSEQPERTPAPAGSDQTRQGRVRFNPETEELEGL